MMVSVKSILQWESAISFLSFSLEIQIVIGAVLPFLNRKLRDSHFTVDNHKNTRSTWESIMEFVLSFVILRIHFNF